LLFLYFLHFLHFGSSILSINNIQIINIELFSIYVHRYYALVLFSTMHDYYAKVLFIVTIYIHYSLFTVHYLLFTMHYSLFTIHHYALLLCATTIHHYSLLFTAGKNPLFRRLRPPPRIIGHAQMIYVPPCTFLY
jgi:hypothetical protein